MKFKKIDTKQSSKEKKFTVDDVKMVRITFTFPAWRSASVDDLLSEFNDSDVYSINSYEIEEAHPTVSELEAFSNSIERDWYFYHSELDITLKQIISNSKRKKAVNESKVDK